MRRAPQDGQKPLPLHENGTKKSVAQVGQCKRPNPYARIRFNVNRNTCWVHDGKRDDVAANNEEVFESPLRLLRALAQRIARQEPLR